MPPQATGQPLGCFGKPHAGTHHDLPNELQVFVERTRYALGDATEIAYQRTLLGFFRPFLTPATNEIALRWMCGSSVGPLKFKMGLLTSRFGASHPLKTCARCIQQDIADRGWPLWHMAHQLPGVWVCAIHGEPLSASTLKSTGVQRFCWLLPAKEHLAAPARLQRPDVSRAFGQFVSRVAASSLPPGVLHPTQISAHLQSLLREHDLLTRGGNVRQRPAATSFIVVSRDLASIPDMEAMPTCLHDAEVQLSRLLRAPRTGTHPLRILAVLFWLLPDELAQSRFLEIHSGSGDAGSYPDISESPSEREREALTGTATLVRPARRGVLRPKRVRGELRTAILQSLRQGVSLSSISAGFGVSYATAYRLLHSEPSLILLWREAHMEQTRRQKRSAWIDASQHHVQPGTKAVRALAPAAYAWLYRNDRNWLLEHAPAPAPSKTRRSTVDWVVRDNRLSKEILSVAEHLRRTKQTKQIRLSEICQGVPALRAKLGVLKRLPLTKSAIEQATRSALTHASE